MKNFSDKLFQFLREENYKGESELHIKIRKAYDDIDEIRANKTRLLKLIISLGAKSFTVRKVGCIELQEHMIDDLYCLNIVIEYYEDTIHIEIVKLSSRRTSSTIKDSVHFVYAGHLELLEQFVTKILRRDKNGTVSR